MRSFSPEAACVVPLALPESTITWMPDVRRRGPHRARLGLDGLVVEVGLLGLLVGRLVLAHRGTAPPSSMDVAPPASVTCLRTFTSFFSGARLPSFSSLAATMSISTV